jgi:hypothetical protein
MLVACPSTLGRKARGVHESTSLGLPPLVP